MIDIIIEIKEVLAVIASLIVGIIVLITKLVKAVKSKNQLSNIFSIEEKTLEFIYEAELFLNYSGEEKKEWVKTKVNQFAIENKLNYDSKFVGILIEKLVDLSKNVNKRAKDMVELL